MNSTTRRDLLRLALAAASAPVFCRHALAADTPRFALGVASGQPRPDGMVLWTRLTGPALPEKVTVRWELAHDENFTRIAASGTDTADALWAHSIHAEPAGLAPARGYFYRFEALGQRSAVGRTRTAPAADAAVARLDFLIASCQRWDHGHFAAWRHAAAEAPDLMIFLGDYIYEYAANPASLRPHEGLLVLTLQQYRDRYAQYKSDPALQAAHATCPWLLVWDDHEVGNDYAGLIGETRAPNFADQRAAAYQAYWEHMPFPMSARPAGADMRIYGRLDWGRLARFHLLDDRQYRDPQACPKVGKAGSNTVLLKDCPDLLDPQRTLLGSTQERWLAEGWSLDQPWNLLAQQTLMARFSRDTLLGENGAQAREAGRYWTDGWDGYTAARNRLLGTVAERKVPGLVVLGGDVHANYVADLKPDYDDPKSKVVGAEFCGTSISSRGPAQQRLDEEIRHNPHVHHARGDKRGYVRFTLDGKLLQATLRSVDDARDADSGIATEARFNVEATRPGVLPG